MISLIPFAKATFAVVDKQVNEFADMVVGFVELKPDVAFLVTNGSGRGPQYK